MKHSGYMLALCLLVSPLCVNGWSTVWRVPPATERQPAPATRVRSETGAPCYRVRHGPLGDYRVPAIRARAGEPCWLPTV